MPARSSKPPSGRATSERRGAETARLALLIGDDEFLASRAVEQITAAARAADPAADVIDRPGADIAPGEVYELLSPSLFGGRRVVVIRAAQDLRAATIAELAPLLDGLPAEVTLALVHSGGAKGKPVLDAARRADAVQVSCSRLTRPEQRLEFIRDEVRRAGGTITPDGAAALLDAVGSDLRELAAVSAQLVSDAGGKVDAAVVAEYHRGRAEVTGFAVADRAVVGDTAGALETLRWALAIGVPHVLLADALADGIRSISRVYAAGRGNKYDLAPRLGMPPWKVERSQHQARGWTQAGLRTALGVVAELNGDVKGVAADPGYALERAIVRLSAARQLR